MPAGPAGGRVPFFVKPFVYSLTSVTFLVISLFFGVSDASVVFGVSDASVVFGDSVASVPSLGLSA